MWDGTLRTPIHCYIIFENTLESFNVAVIRKHRAPESLLRVKEYTQVEAKECFLSPALPPINCTGSCAYLSPYQWTPKQMATFLLTLAQLSLLPHYSVWVYDHTGLNSKNVISTYWNQEFKGDCRSLDTCKPTPLTQNRFVMWWWDIWYGYKKFRKWKRARTHKRFSAVLIDRMWVE